LSRAQQPTRIGVIHYGSTGPAMDEAVKLLGADGVHVDALRVRGFPFSHEVTDFIADHEQVFVVEQNRDAQLRTLLLAECGIDPAQLVAVLHYDGTPITARFIRREIAAKASVVRTPARREVLS
ncbi:MAG: 2-oxoacid:acceptor oxidoreductase subunit alpha, partial [Phreatobacter sp.]